jgi:glutamyl-Q tRNA(Asp) synthetase
MRTRFAPSPTGPLHLGHAYSAILAHDMARASGGEFLLRIEDIDQGRARREWEDLICDDLAWLGLSWDGPVLRQSERMPAYSEALDRLWSVGLLYPCTCSRRDVAEAANAPQEGMPTGPDGIIYPGTCRPPRPPIGPRPADAHLRLDMARAATGPVRFTETGRRRDDITVTPDTLISMAGDIVLARRDMGTSYHLSVVVDDAAQVITHVTRGEDLFEATPIHVLLQRLLGLPTPTYHHHRLIRDENDKRLAKRNDAKAIRTYREGGATPADIRQMIGLG